MPGDRPTRSSASRQRGRRSDEVLVLVVRWIWGWPLAQYLPRRSNLEFGSWPVDYHLSFYQLAAVSGATNKDTNSMIFPILKYFAYSHLPAHLQEISKPFGELANQMVESIPLNDETWPELSAGLRKLLEAKDCFVRASLCK